MPALPPVPKTIQFTLFYNDNGNANVHNILYYTYSGTLALADLTTLCNNVMTAWGAQFAAQTMPSCSLVGVIGNDLSSNLAPKSASTSAAVPGTNAGQNLSNGATPVFSYLTSRKYRGGHSRTYTPGAVRNSLSDGNTWSGTARTAMQAAWVAFLNAIVTTAVPAAVGQLTHVVAHRYGKTATSPVSGTSSPTRSVPLTTPFTDPVTAVVLNPQIGSQRRRNQQSA